MNDSHGASPPAHELRARILSAAVMGVVVLAAVAIGGVAFAAMVAIGAFAALREWHRLVNGGQAAREMFVSIAAVLAAIVLTEAHWVRFWPGAVLAAGALTAGLSALMRRAAPLWHGLGALYVGLTAVSLVALRADAPSGGFLVIGILIAVWASDTGALFAGRTFGGAKLAPALSPNKTWAGLLGGVIAAGAAEALYAQLLGGIVWQATLFGFLLALVGQCGDLFESWVKRRFHARHSGRLIPGHGGMLDRIDSLLVAVPIGAALVFLAGFDPLMGSAP